MDTCFLRNGGTLYDVAKTQIIVDNILHTLIHVLKNSLKHKMHKLSLMCRNQIGHVNIMKYKIYTCINKGLNWTYKSTAHETHLTNTTYFR